MKMTDYTPIACSVYDLLEAAAVRHSELRIELLPEAGSSSPRNVQILDLFSEDKAEFMKARDVHSGEILIIKLDQLRIIVDPATNKTYTPRAC